MTQERVNNNNSYAFVLEDPSKPRKYQLNFNLDTDYVKEAAQMDQPISHHHHQYSPLHNQRPPPQQQLQQQRLPTQITLPPISELIQISPPVSQVNSSAHHHHYHHQPHSHQQESLMTLSARPHLPPLQPPIVETPSNPSAFNYQPPFHNSNNNTIQNDKNDRIINDRMDQSNLHPSSLQQQQQPVLLPTSDAYNSYQNYSSSHFTSNHHHHHHHQPPPPQPPPSHQRKYQQHYQTNIISQHSQSTHHVPQQQQQQLSHQSYQQIQQHSQHTHVTQQQQQQQHHHNNHHHNHHPQPPPPPPPQQQQPPQQQPPPPQQQQQQQNPSQTHRHQQKHHVATNNSPSSSSSSTIPQNYHPNVYSNDIVIHERSQHDLQSASAVPSPYNAHNRPSYYPQVYPSSSPPHLHHPMSQQQQQQQQSLPSQQMISQQTQQTISTPSSDLLSNRTISSADHSVIHSQQNVDKRFIHRESIDSHNIAQEQQHQHNSKSPQPQFQPYRSKVQPQPLSDLLNPPRSISRPITPPQLQVPPQQSLIARDNRETSPYLAPPPHHQSGSSSSVSTRSSSPAPSTPVANTNATLNAISNSNHTLPYSPHNSPNNNMIPAHIDKSTTEQNTSQVKKRGRSQKPRPIVPAGPLPSQPTISSQAPPQSSTANDSPVFVPYVVPMNGSNNAVDATPQLSAPKSSHATRPRKNSSVVVVGGVGIGGGGIVPSVPKRARKQKDNVPAYATPIPERGDNNNNNNNNNNHNNHNHKVQNPHQLPHNPEDSFSSPLMTTISTNPATSTVPSRKREHSAPSSPRDISDVKRCKKEESIDNDVDVMMEDVSVTKDDYTKNNASDETGSSSSSKGHMEAVMILQSLKESENSNNLPARIVPSPLAASDAIHVKEEIVEQTSLEPKTDQVEHFVATKVRELSLEDDQFTPLVSIKKEEEEEEIIKSSSFLSRNSVKNSRSHEDVKPVLISNKSNKKGIGDGNNNRGGMTDRVAQVKRVTPVAVNNHNVGNDSDNDLAMDDGSDDEEDAKCNQPVNNQGVDDNAWNSDDMETEEEVEEEVVIFENTGVKEEESKPTLVSSPSPLPSLPSSTTSHQSLVRTKNDDDSRDTPSPTPAVTSTTKHSRPASPITSSCGTVSSLVSRKGSVSSNGSNKEILSDVLDTPSAMPSPSAVTPNHSINGNGRPQRPCPPRRRSTMRDDEKLELDAIEWEKNIEIPHHIWEETLRVFEIVKHSKEMKNRQPHRKRNHILASILFILCRQNGLPRTFVEICNAASIRKQEIGSYYRLMQKVFESNGLGGGSNGTVDSAEYLKRWCQNLKLPSHILDAAIHIYKQASELNITTGKCPVSVGAASIWLSISSWNEIRSSWNSSDDHEQIKCEHKDVAQAAGVVNATLVGCFKNLSKYKDKLLPAEFLQEAQTRPPHHKKSDFSESNAGNNTAENDCRDEKKSASHSPPHSLENLKSYGPPLDEDEEASDSEKAKVETIKVEPTIPSISALPSKVDPTASSGLRPSQKVESSAAPKIFKTENDSKFIKVEPTLSSLKEIKTEKSSNATESLACESQEDADDELEEGELREDCDDVMMD